MEAINYNMNIETKLKELEEMMGKTTINVESGTEGRPDVALMIALHNAFPALAQALRNATRDAEAGRVLMRTVKHLYEQPPTVLEIAMDTYNKRIKE